MTPAAYDRQTGSRYTSEKFVSLSTRLIAVALFPLLVSLSLDAIVVTNRIFEDNDLAMSTGICVFFMFAFLWYGLPRLIRRR